MNSKPRIGQEIRFTKEGSDFYFRVNGRLPANNGVLGNVVSFASEGRICTVKNSKGDTDSFIWVFSDGLNAHFEWDGKSNENPNK